MITYTSDIKDISIEMLDGGFFVDWPNPPAPTTHYRILKQSYSFIAAVDQDRHKVIGFINVVSDGVLSAYIPLLEVLPEYQSQGIGAQLVKQMLEQLKELYMIDLICDTELQPYYERLGLMKAHGMLYRNYHAQSGKVE